MTATAAKAGAKIEIKNGATAVTNGGSATWATGANVLTIKVTYGTTVRTYKVTVTKGGEAGAGVIRARSHIPRKEGAEWTGQRCWRWSKAG